MYRITDLRLELDGTERDLKRAAARRLGVRPAQIRSVKLYRRAVDARRRDDVHFTCTVDADCPDVTAPRGRGVTAAEERRR